MQSSIDPIIQQAQNATRKAQAIILKNYTKDHNIQRFDIEDIVTIKIPKENRTSTNNKRLFKRILQEPHLHRCIKRLILTKT
jgi:hypothetical protein